jgi:hypothetical protein
MITQDASQVARVTPWLVAALARLTGLRAPGQLSHDRLARLLVLRPESVVSCILVARVATMLT